jgi:hypothetical protein
MIVMIIMSNGDDWGQDDGNDYDYDVVVVGWWWW